MYMVYCNREFKPLLNDAWEQLELTINYANTEDHVGEAERNNRFLKERFRTKFLYLPYKAIPKVMIRGLAIEVAKHANFFPVKGELNKEILSSIKILVFHLALMLKQLKKPPILLKLVHVVLFTLVFLQTFKVVMKLWHWSLVTQSVLKKLPNILSVMWL